MGSLPARGDGVVRDYDLLVSLDRSALVRRFLRPVALVIVLTFAMLFVIDNWTGIRTGMARLEPGALSEALVAILAGLFAAMLSWRAVLAGMGSPLPVLAASRVYFLGQLGKYIPGSVWPILAQAELSREYGVPRARAGFAAMTQMIVGLVVGVVAAGVSLAASSGAAMSRYWWLVFVVVGGGVALVPSVLNRLIHISSSLVRRPITTAERITGRAVLISAAWSGLMWLMFGVHLWLLARGVGASSDRLFLLTTGGYALAWVVGFVIIFLPAGAGAREATLILALAPAINRDNALALALISRFLMLLGDGLSAGGAISGELIHRRLAPAVRESNEPPVREEY